MSNCRWFVVTNGTEWRLYKTQLKGSESPLSACERYFLSGPHREPLAVSAILCHVPAGPRFCRTGTASARLDGLRRKSEEWQESISEAIYDKLVESRLVAFPRHPARSCPIGRNGRSTRRSSSCCFGSCSFVSPRTRPCCPRHFSRGRSSSDSSRTGNGGGETTLYGYVQQYFAWLDGRARTSSASTLTTARCSIPTPFWTTPNCESTTACSRTILLKLSREAMGRPIDYSQINPRIFGNIYEKVPGIRHRDQGASARPAGGPRHAAARKGPSIRRSRSRSFSSSTAVDEALARRPGRKPWELVCLDPACGSGHFLVEYVNYVAARCEELDDRRSYQQWKRYVTQHGVFGVDKDSTAVMLTKLSLWINSAMQDEPFVTIDTHIKCGNSLVCGTPPGFRLADFEKKAYPEKFRELKRLRKELAELEVARGLRRLPVYGRRSSRPASPGSRRLGQNRGGERAHPRRIQHGRCWSDARAWKQRSPLHWEIEFAEVFEEQGGFDLVVGNPPWGADLSEIREYLDGGAFRARTRTVRQLRTVHRAWPAVASGGRDVRVHHPRQHHSAGARAVAPHVAGPNRA